MKLVETIDYLASELFTIRFLHSGFDSPAATVISDVMHITPDTKTYALMRNYSMDCSFSGNVFVCYIRSRREASPPQPLKAYIIPQGELQLRFLIKADSQFMNATVIEPAASGFVYHFSNRTNAGTGMFITHGAGNVDHNDLQTITDVDNKEVYTGVIDIFSSGAINSNYELFANTAGELKQPAYRVQFASRI